ncbi:MAG: hypothetical protein ACK5L6_08445 [Anaerorhabdus sp.]|uniref:hypothetical protein n=1 Tax=Anaerorhabdus sp. TaxID=1872524 RepID=UPI003A85868A
MIKYANKQCEGITFNQLSDGCSILIQSHFIELYINKELQFTQYKVNDGNPIHIFEYSDLTIAIVLGDDVVVPEIGRYLACKKVDFVLCIDQENKVNDLLLGPWNIAQSNCMYVGYYSSDLLIYAPCDLTLNYCGQLEQGKLSRHNLAKAYRSFPILDSLNPTLYKEQW